MDISRKIRRTLCILTAVLLTAALSGCLKGISGQLPGNSPEPKILAGYSCDITAAAIIIPPEKEKEEEFEFSGHLKRLGTGFWELELTAPETVTGLKIALSDDKVTSRIDDLSFDSPASEIPSPSPVMCIFKSLDSAAVKLSEGGKLTAPKSGEKDSLYFTGDNYAIRFDGSGVPVSIEISSPRVTVSITNFTE